MEIGFMQGRLCDRIDGKIQAFPWRDWESEFSIAQRLGISLMEWTLDQENLYNNPFMTQTGQQRICELSRQTGIRVLSLTGDCFMQAPFFKTTGEERLSLLQDLRAVLQSSALLGLHYVVMPLVDNATISSIEEEISLQNGLLPLHEELVAMRLKILFESDLSPQRLAHFIKQFPAATFGINYDIGNSASLGYQPSEEISAYGHRIDNVHIKDRIHGGTTVPLGAGDANFPEVFSHLRKIGYAGNFILQTARAADNNHSAALARYRDMTMDWWADES